MVSEQVAGVLYDVQLTLNLPVELYLDVSASPVCTSVYFSLSKLWYRHLMILVFVNRHSSVTAEFTSVAITSPASNDTALGIVCKILQYQRRSRNDGRNGQDGSFMSDHLIKHVTRT